jgi:RAQPRD family integrative conjugative element protein
MKLFFLVVVSSFLSLNAVAGTDAATEAEKRYLIKIAQELTHLETLAQKAADNADPDARVTLDYVALRNDLQEIKRALETHVSKPSRTPRNLRDLELARN